MSQPETSVIQTRSQQLGTRAFCRLESVDRMTKPDKTAREKYVSFAKRFPALVHTCGLAQAVAFAHAKAPDGYLDDLRAVMMSEKNDVNSFDVPSFAAEIRSAELSEYMRLSRTALEAAGWLKRYAEALLEND